MKEKNRKPLTVKDMRVLAANVVNGIPDDLPDEIADYLNKNRDKLHLMIREILFNAPSIAIGYCFKLINTFYLTVPDNYLHSACLDLFKKRYTKEFCRYDDNISDKNFGRATTILTPGRKFMVKVFHQIISGFTTSEERIEFLRSQGAVFVGAQGASLVFEQKRDRLLKEFRYTSFDDKEALGVDSDGRIGVPCFFSDSTNKWHFILRRLEYLWEGNDCLLCFCDPLTG